MPVADDCDEWGVCCEISNYYVDVGNFQVHIVGDLISVFSTLELLFLVGILLLSYSNLETSVAISGLVPKKAFRSVYFIFTFVIAGWFFLELIIIFLPLKMESLLLYFFYDGHGWNSNFLKSKK